MYVLPAVDMLDGNVVRLLRGDYAAKTTYGASAVDQVASFAEAGAGLVHVVDLGAAKSGEPALDDWAALAFEGGPKIQLGGGIRTAELAAACVGAGVHRVIMGTAAVWDPPVLEAAVASCGTSAVVAAIDIRDGRARGAGWLDVGRPFADVLSDVQAAGVHKLLVTAVSRDGTLTGPDLEILGAVRDRAPAAEIIAAGGIGTIEHVRMLARTGVDGAVVGRALYEGSVDPREAMAEFPWTGDRL